MFKYNLKKLRQERNLTQEKLAELSGVPQSTISDMECNKTDAKTSTLIMLAKCLNTAIDKLIEY